MNIGTCRYPFAATFLSLLLAGAAAAHERIVPVIVDTDMALDDARALAMLLGAPEIQVQAIITSDGACPPAVGATNVCRIFHQLDRTGIPVGAGSALGKPAPPWAERSMALGWSDLPLPSEVSVGDAPTVLSRVFSNSSNTVTWFCLGPLSNLAELLQREPAVKNRIGRVYFYGNPPDAEQLDWNTARDLDAAHCVFSSGLEVIAVQLVDGQVPVFDAVLLKAIAELDAPSARVIARLHAHPKVRRLVEERHFRAWDETLVLLFHEPWLGRLRSAGEGSRVRVLDELDTAAARRVYLDRLRLGSSPAMQRPLVTLREFPVHPDQYREDLRPLLSKILNRHGTEEWKLNVLTSELHRHLGLYSILGAKMGLRARELLGASLDELEVESLAGLRPPVSCLNDGLQVSTGASLGRGTIRVADTAKPQAAAVFTSGERRLLLRVREDAVRQIQKDLRLALQEYGDLTPAYFAEVRRVALKAWLALDRRQIFEETLLAEQTAPE